MHFRPARAAVSDFPIERERGDLYVGEQRGRRDLLAEAGVNIYEGEGFMGVKG